jgi:hypothetical protein
MKKEKKDQIIRRISEQSMLKLTPMPHGTIWMIAINGRAKNLFTLPMLCFVCGLYVKKKSIWDVIANAAISIVLPQK